MVCDFRWKSNWKPYPQLKFCSFSNEYFVTTKYLDQVLFINGVLDVDDEVPADALIALALASASSTYAFEYE